MALKILLADDSMTAQNLGKKILAEAGYEVVTVSNGAAAVKKIAEVSPQLCILDIYMPGYTGLEVCEKVKTASATSRMPVLLTVGKMEPYKPEEGARVRADGVIVKPFEASELLRAVHRFTQRATSSASGQRSATPPPPAVPSSSPSAYEKTVKLTREQIQTIMDPSMTAWKGTGSPDVAAAATATVFEVDGVAGSTPAPAAEAMPAFAVATVVEEHSPVAMVDPQETAAMMDLATLPSATTVEASSYEIIAPSASTVLPGFVDYLIANSNGAAAHAAEFQPTPVAENIAFQPMGHAIPAIDPSLEIAPSVQVDMKPDPQFESAADLPVANATEDGLQPTSRATESENVVTTTDPNLAPMDGVMDVKPAEGAGTPAVNPEVTFSDTPVEAQTEQPSGEAKVQEEAADEPLFATPKRSKRGKEMRAIPAEPAESAPLKIDATEEISAVLDLLVQTTSTPATHADTGNGTEHAGIEQPSTAKVWMAEEVALSDAEATLSLENEMRVAYAPKALEEEPADEPIFSMAPIAVQPAAEVAIASSEEPVRDDKNAPNAAMPGTGGSQGSGASPTQDLAAAMAAAFGGALPQEDLARAEETQSISEEVRRFALGDAYKAKPGFGGAAIDDSGEKYVSSEKLAAAIGRVLDRMKPQIVAEILKELESAERE